jgi:hypothetical protein
MEMIERFLFDGVDSHGARLAIDITDEHAPLIATAPAESCLPLRDMTMVRTQLTFHPPIVQPLIISALVCLHQKMIAS